MEPLLSNLKSVEATPGIPLSNPAKPRGLLKNQLGMNSRLQATQDGSRNQKVAIKNETEESLQLDHPRKPPFGYRSSQGAIQADDFANQQPKLHPLKSSTSQNWFGKRKPNMDQYEPKPQPLASPGRDPPEGKLYVNNLVKTFQANSGVKLTIQNENGGPNYTLNKLSPQREQKGVHEVGNQMKLNKRQFDEYRKTASLTKWRITKPQHVAQHLQPHVTQLERTEQKEAVEAKGSNMGPADNRPSLPAVLPYAEAAARPRPSTQPNVMKVMSVEQLSSMLGYKMGSSPPDNNVSIHKHKQHHISTQEGPSQARNPLKMGSSKPGLNSGRNPKVRSKVLENEEYAKQMLQLDLEELRELGTSSSALQDSPKQPKQDSSSRARFTDNMPQLRAKLMPTGVPKQDYLLAGPEPPQVFRDLRQHKQVSQKASLGPRVKNPRQRSKLHQD